MVVVFANIFVVSLKNNIKENREIVQNAEEYTIQPVREIKNISRASINNRLEVIYYQYYKLTLNDENFVVFEDEELAKEKMEYLIQNTEDATFNIENMLLTYTIDISSNEEIINFTNECLTKFKIKPKKCYPVESKSIINSSFGHRRSGFHTGIDLNASYGDNVYAYKKGVVEYVNYSQYSYGNQVVIKHEDGTCSRYAHLSTIKVEEGQNVSCGQKIGEAGSTGNSTGVHLHFEILINNKQVNPYGYLF